MQSLVWEEYKYAFATDGSKGCILIHQVSLSDWQDFINFLRKTDATLSFTHDGIGSELPARITSEVFRSGHANTLIVHFDSIILTCNFQAPWSIELKFDPIVIDNEAKAKVVFRVMSTVGRTLDKTVSLTSETDHKPLLEYVPGSGIKYAGNT